MPLQDHWGPEGLQRRPWWISSRLYLGLAKCVLRAAKQLKAVELCRVVGHRESRVVGYREPGWGGLWGVAEALGLGWSVG